MAGSTRLTAKALRLVAATLETGPMIASPTFEELLAQGGSVPVEGWDSRRSPTHP
jgi:hypothetical protein